MLLQYDTHFFSTLSKNLGNWRDFFGQMVYRPPWQNISRTPMRLFNFVMRNSYCKSLKKSFFIIYVTFDMYFIERIRTLLLLSSF